MKRLQPLETANLRQVTYTRKKYGFLKQAKEISILCDNDIALLMFSPTGNPTLFHGKRSNVNDIIAKYVNTTPHERERRKLESLTRLRKLHYDVDVQEFMGSSSSKPSVEIYVVYEKYFPVIMHENSCIMQKKNHWKNLTIRTRILRSVLTEKHKKLSAWVNPEKVKDVEQLRQMEGKICASLRHIRPMKSYRKDHPDLWNVTPDTSRLQNTPLIPKGDDQCWILPDPASFLPPTHVGSSTSASARFNKQSDVGDLGQLDKIGKVTKWKQLELSSSGSSSIAVYAAE